MSTAATAPINASAIQVMVPAQEETSYKIVVDNERFAKLPADATLPETAELFNSDPAYLSKQSMRQLDSWTGDILRAKISSSKTKSEALGRLTAALGALPMLQEEPKKQAVKPAKVKTSPHPRTDLQKFMLHPKFHYKSEQGQNMVKELAPQAQACIRIMHEGGQAEYTGEQLRILLGERKDLLKTSQDPFRIFQYYRGAMIASEIVKIDG